MVTKEGGGDYRMQAGAESALGGVQVLSQKEILRSKYLVFKVLPQIENVKLQGKKFQEQN